MVRFRFLQLSDLHLGAPVSSARLGLAYEKQVQREEEFANLIRSIPRVMEEHQLDALIMPGDLWDHETLKGKQLEYFKILYQVICEISPKPVVIAPGNHDFYSKGSMYHNNTLRLKGFEPWPPHVYIFTEPSFKTIPLNGWENKIKITGRAFQDNTLLIPDSEENSLRLLRELSPQNPSEYFKIMLFHGSKDDYNKYGQNITSPFSTQELLNLDLDYVAVGHYHSYELFTNKENEIKGAYSGSAFGRGLDETGARYALIVDMVKNGDKPAVVSVEPVTLDNRCVTLREIILYNVNGLEDAESVIFEDLKATSQQGDIVFCELKGQVSPDLPLQWPQMIETKLMKEHGFFHVKLNDKQIIPAYDIARLREASYSLEGRYIQAMEHRIEQAETEEEKVVLRKALFLGLDALTGCEIRTP